MGIVERPPAGWKSDHLSEFIEVTWTNLLATFQSLPRIYKLIRDVDEQFHTAAENMKNPPDPLAALFLMRAHSAFRASARLAMSGQIPEANMVLRGALENALYGFFIHQAPDMALVWIKRHEDEESMKNVKAKFRISVMFDLLKEQDAALGEVVHRLYQRTIDFGGHPNERAVLTNLEQTETEDSMLFNSIYAAGDGTWLRGCLKTCIEVGVACLKIFGLVFTERFDLLGVSEFSSSFRPAAD